MKIQELKELLTPEFLSTLHTAVECCGWDVDMIESMEFCKWCYHTAGQLEPEYDMSVEMEDEE
jgi:uncharacterized protein YeaC (DUF1315 family)